MDACPVIVVSFSSWADGSGGPFPLASSSAVFFHQIWFLKNVFLFFFKHELDLVRVSGDILTVLCISAHTFQLSSILHGILFSLCLFCILLFEDYCFTFFSCHFCFSGHNSLHFSNSIQLPLFSYQCKADWLFWLFTACLLFGFSL